MTALSTVHRGAPVTFPPFTGERTYMRRFERGTLLPADLARWQPTVDAMLKGVVSTGPVYLMVDQMRVAAGQHHRRPGLHVDWYWHDVMRAHGGGGGHHPFPPGHQPTPAPQPEPSPEPPKEAIVLAASTLGCRAYCGTFEGRPKDDGDAAHIDVSGLEVVDMLPGYAWICDAGSTLHETLPEARDVLRTVVRLNVTGWKAAR